MFIGRKKFPRFKTDETTTNLYFSPFSHIVKEDNRRGERKHEEMEKNSRVSIYIRHNRIFVSVDVHTGRSREPGNASPSKRIIRTVGQILVLHRHFCGLWCINRGFGLHRSIYSIGGQFRQTGGTKKNIQGNGCGCCLHSLIGQHYLCRYPIPIPVQLGCYGILPNGI